MLKKLNYRPVIEYGVLTGIKRNSIVLEGDEPVQGFDTATDLQEYVRVRKIPTLIYQDLLDENGEPDPERTAQQYAEYYANLEAVAVPWEPDLMLTANQPYPVSHNGKLYEVIQGHTTQSDWTPDIVPALFSEIQAPTPVGYPAWVQKFAPPYYQIGDRVTHNGQNWECIAADANGNNVWEPGVYGWKIIA